MGAFDNDIEDIIRELQQPSISNRRWAYREAASIQVSFDLASLVLLSDGGTPASKDDAYQHLKDDSYEASGSRGRRMLKREVRQKTFARMTPDQARKLLQLNPPADDDSTQRVLTAFIRGEAFDPTTRTIGELEAAMEVLSWFPVGFSGLPSREQIGGILPRRRLFSRLPPSRNFVGRERELARLREYVDLPGDPTPSGSRRDLPAILFGVGGIGKSALVGAFLRQYGSEKDPVFPFVYLDFDNPLLQVDQQQPGKGDRFRLSNLATILLAGVDQISDHYGAHEHFKKIREELSNASLDTNGPNPERSLALCRSFGAVVREVLGGRDDIPLLFVFDTFEEAQAVSRQAEVQLIALFRDLQKGFLKVRMLVSGRAQPIDLSVALRASVGWRLFPLGRLASFALLSELGVNDTKLQREIYNEIGGSPLDLRLVSEVIRRRDIQSFPVDEQIQWLHANIFDVVDGPLVTGNLYLRIVDHIHSGDGRQFANPGLVLRRITPAAIFHVLNGPCNLGFQNIEQARSLFEDLEREVFLFDRPRGHNFLRIRQDVRPIVLKLIERSKPDEVVEIENEAITFNEPSKDPIDRADEIYYRLRRGQDAKKIEERWIPGVETYLAYALPELPEESRLFLASKLRILVPGNTSRSAGVKEWEQFAKTNMEKWLVAGFPEIALRIATEREPEQQSPETPVLLLQAKAHFLLDEFDDAAVLVTPALQAARAAKDKKAELQAVLLDAILSDIRNDARRADSLLLGAETLARTTTDHVRFCKIQLYRRELRTRNKGLPELAPDWELILLDTIRKVPDAQMPPALFRSAACAFGPRQPSIFLRALQLGDLSVGVDQESVHRHGKELSRRTPDFVSNWLRRPFELNSKKIENVLMEEMAWPVALGREILQPFTYPAVDPHFGLLSDVPPPEEFEARDFSAFHRYLAGPKLQEIRDAVVRTIGQSPLHRQGLLEGIPASVTVRLAIADDQILADLHGLNKIQHIADGSIPLKQWLDNALDQWEEGDLDGEAAIRRALERVKDIALFDRSQKPEAKRPEPVIFPSCVICYAPDSEFPAELLYTQLRIRDVQCWLARTDRASIPPLLRVYRDCIIIADQTQKDEPWFAELVQIATDEEKLRADSPVLIRVVLGQDGAFQILHTRPFTLEPVEEAFTDQTKALDCLLSVLRDEQREPRSKNRGDPAA